MIQIHSLKPTEVEYLESLDSAFVEVDKRIQSFNRAWAKEQEYGLFNLEVGDKIIELQRQIKAINDRYSRAKRADKSGLDLLTMLAVEDYDGKQAMLKRLVRERIWITDAQAPTRIPADRVATARDYPIHLVAGVPESSRITCPIMDHHSPDPCFKLYGNHGHCFKCNKSLGVINYVMLKSGVVFKQAVNIILGCL